MNKLAELIFVENERLPLRRREYILVKGRTPAIEQIQDVIEDYVILYGGEKLPIRNITCVVEPYLIAFEKVDVGDQVVMGFDESPTYWIRPATAKMVSNRLKVIAEPKNIKFIYKDGGFSPIEIEDIHRILSQDDGVCIVSPNGIASTYGYMNIQFKTERESDIAPQYELTRFASLKGKNVRVYITFWDRGPADTITQIELKQIYSKNRYGIKKQVFMIYDPTVLNIILAVLNKADMDPELKHHFQNGAFRTGSNIEGITIEDLKRTHNKKP